MSLKTYLPFGRPCFGEEEIAAVIRVLRSGWVGMGPETQAFEKVCNLGCIHCSHRLFEKSPRYWGLHLDPALNEKRVAEAWEFGGRRPQYLRYTCWGELLLYP